MANITREERLRRNEAEKQQAKEGSEFGGVTYVGLQEQIDAANAIDERKPDWRPATIVDHTTQEAAPDERRFPGDLGKSVNVMVGRAAITENSDPHPGVTLANNPPVVADLHGRLAETAGDEIQLLRGYQPHPDSENGPLPPKRLPGEVFRVPSREAKRLVNVGAAKFIED